MYKKLNKNIQKVLLENVNMYNCWRKENERKNLQGVVRRDVQVQSCLLEIKIICNVQEISNECIIKGGLTNKKGYLFIQESPWRQIKIFQTYILT